MNEKEELVKWNLVPYQNEQGNWIPKAKITVEKDGVSQTIPIEATEFEYEDKKEAEQHAHYLVKDYIAKNVL